MGAGKPDEAVTKVAEFEVKSWDEVFSRPFKKGKQLPRRGVRAFRLPQKFGGVPTLAAARAISRQRLLCGDRERAWHWRCHRCV